MLGIKRMPRPLSESRKPESRRKIAVLRGMRLRPIDSPHGFPGQPCGRRGGGGVSKHRLREPSRADFREERSRIFPGQPCAMRVRVPSGTRWVRGVTSAALQATFDELRESASAVADLVL